MLAFAFGGILADPANAEEPVADGLYKLQCGDSVADGGQLNAIGVLEVRAARVSGTMRLELKVSSEDVDSPEAEQHVLPTLNVGGLAELSTSKFSATDGRPTRISLNLKPANWSMKDRLETFNLVDNNAPDGGDDETSHLIFDRQTYTGVCKIEKK